ncbi:hypothetical protein [Streptomyces sp. NPDC090093]|uniref:hypothetical protein n=1 Tax=Streptomyces sp. NPDC090093 TaxID=3365945 RepID=UPI0037FCAC06
MAFYAVRQAAAVHSAHLLGAGRDERRDVGRQVLLPGAALGTAAAGAFPLTAGPVVRLLGAGPGVAGAGPLFLRRVGPYLIPLGGYIALAGVFEGTPASPYLARITLAGASPLSGTSPTGPSRAPGVPPARGRSRRRRGAAP